MTENESALRHYLTTLTVRELRAMAVDMRYRWESRRTDLVNFLVEYVPHLVSAHRDEHATTTTLAAPPTNREERHDVGTQAAPQ